MSHVVKNHDAVINELTNVGPGEASPILFEHSAAHLTKAINTVYPDVYGDDNYDFKRSLEKNVVEFSIFKSASFAENLKGKTPEEQTAILEAYERQLQTEGSLATRVARSAVQWQEYERTSNVYPNIEYLESRSVDKREAHKQYYGLIFPINHPFWDDHFPPNGWNCKCRTRKSDGDVYTGDVPKISKVKGITGNAGKSRRVFEKNHPHIASVTPAGKKQLRNQLEQLKTDLPYGKVDYKADNGSSINVHLFADDQDLNENFEAAKIVADDITGTSIKIRPHSIGFGKNPEYIINGKIADLKLNRGKNVGSAIKRAINQNCTAIVFKIDRNSPLSSKRLVQRINGEIQAKSNQLERVIIIDKNNKVIDLKIEKGKLY